MSSATKFYQGKSGLVTGGGAGMGRAMAIAFAAAGAKVLVTDVNVKGGKETVAAIRKAGGEAKFLRTDVSNARDVEAMVAAIVADYGKLDFAVNNAGVDCEGAPLADVDDKMFDKVVGINLKGVFLCMKHEIRQMVKQGSGAIVNIGSINSFRPQPGLSVYTATKHGVVGMTRNAAVDYAAKGVRINAICPGAIDTPMLEAGMKRLKGHKVTKEQALGALSLLGRAGMPEEIAKAALWLCSDEASFTYGHALAIDGGYLAR
jgi:NAD(P)-dependent dehydrogenase (short-subunit alcohol dehydrogenase family)